MKSEIFLSAIVAISKNRVIGDGKGLMWDLPEDLKNLKMLTIGCPLIMGRRTFDSIGKPLPGRANIVLTKNNENLLKGALKANSFNEAIKLANNWILQNNPKNSEIFLFGGSQIYQFGIKYCKYIYLTEIDIYLDSKICFPEIQKDSWDLIFNSGLKTSKNQINYTHYKFERRSKINLNNFFGD